MVGDVAELSFFASIFGCKWSKDPPKYLGFPLGGKPNEATMWDQMIDKCQNKLNGWRSMHLSYGAKLVLCKAVLCSMPTYLFSLFKAPTSVINDLEKIQKRFMWNGASESKRMALVEWKTCKAEIKAGGLGIHDLRSFNDAMLAKWLWRFAPERNSWWRELIEIKYPNPQSIWQTDRARNGFSH
ncbi:unnamed protein product [Linum trigynum]|uniref:Uncharacterized protein n=1 Tax=Linum trigynum TaxID=586398 RepID=A0AAV2FWM6_9ROSI